MHAYVASPPHHRRTWKRPNTLMHLPNTPPHLEFGVLPPYWGASARHIPPTSADAYSITAFAKTTRMILSSHERRLFWLEPPRAPPAHLL
ncbi:hypothetical protein A0H81_07279 [Grifola frondosa]|uniref:Uncharacterized protein n=1 Tax=Grifola frondosa TaxID=5627 RepID=A0A1C7M9J9_GRIFR|nr:hypothetical protein A0H81_07279 [Grifola frondosa]